MTLTVGSRELYRGRPLFVLAICAGTFTALRLGQVSGGLKGWPACFLDDLISLPLVLGIVLAAHRLADSSRGFTLPVGHGLAAFLFFSLYFEVILPRIHTGFTADPWDVVMYGAGWCVFHWGINRQGSA